MPRPLQNRVLATGEIKATPERGLFMGNRGILHDDHQTLGKALWRHKAWIICVLQWKDWHRQVMRPGNYTELFFLDDAVALAAGHRPCALCRRADYNAYRDAAGIGIPAPAMDAALHTERAIPRTFAQRRHLAKAESLPDGTVIWDAAPKLVWHDRQYPATAGSYGPPEPRIRGEVTVLTPPTSRVALLGGYRPVLHPSLGIS